MAKAYAKTALSPAQVKMILRIYWTNKYQQAERGRQATKGVRDRLAKQFGVSKDVIKKITDIRPIKGKRRRRFTDISVSLIQRTVKRRLQRQRGETNVGS